MTARKLTVLALVAGAAAALAAFAPPAPSPQDAGWPGRPHRGAGRSQARIEHAARRLDLTATQRTQVRDVIERHRDELRAARLQVSEARAALRQATEGWPLDPGAVRLAADRLGVAIGERAVLMGRVHDEVRQLLTAEQAATLDALRAEREARLQERRQAAAAR